MSDQYPPPSYPSQSGGGQWPGDDPNAQQPQQPQQPGYGAPQQPGYGAPQQPGYGEAQQPGYGAPGQPAYGDPAYGAPAPGDPGPGYGAPPPKKRSTGKIIGIVVGVLVLLGVLCIVGVVLVAKNLGEDSVNAQVNDCLAGDSIDASGKTDTGLDIDIVKCDDADAKYKVYGRVENKTFAEAETNRDEICGPFVDKGAEFYIWLGPPGELTKPSPVVCVGPPK